MSRVLDLWLQRIKDVEREYAVARWAIDKLLGDIERDPSLLVDGGCPLDIRKASVYLEGTYVIRLFAEFESGLRNFWQTYRSTSPPAKDLLDGIAASRRIPNDVLTDAHGVREYRNHLVHERDQRIDSIPVSRSRRSLCIFFSFLPPKW